MCQETELTARALSLFGCRRKGWRRQKFPRKLGGTLRPYPFRTSARTGHSATASGNWFSIERVGALGCGLLGWQPELLTLIRRKLAKDAALIGVGDQFLKRLPGRVYFQVTFPITDGDMLAIG